MKFAILLIINTFIAISGWAAENVLWQSDILAKPYINARLGSFTEKGLKEVALMSARDLEVHSFQAGKLHQIAKVSFLKSFEPLRLNRFDLQNDGRDELIVSGLSNGRAQSIIYSLQSGVFKPVSEVPYYVSVIGGDLDNQLIGQKKFGAAVYSGVPFALQVKGSQLVEGESLLNQKGIWAKNIPLYSMNRFKTEDGHLSWAIADSEGYIAMYESGLANKMGGTGGSFGGSVFHIDSEVRNVLNELVSAHIEIPLRQLFDNGLGLRDYRDLSLSQTKVICDDRDQTLWHPPCLPESQRAAAIVATQAEPLLYVVKSEDYLKNIVGARPAIKQARLMALKWNGHSLQEAWSSLSFEGGIADFDLAQWDDDAPQEVLILNTIRGNGYWETQKGLRSQLIVINKKSE